MKVIPNGASAQLPTIPREGTLLQERGADPIYVMRGLKKVHIPSMEAFRTACFHPLNVRRVPAGSLAGIPDGGPFF